MYDNRVHLMGFLGKDAALRQTSTGREFVVLSLATTASWRDERGEYTDKTRRTDWHRCIAWSNLSKRAGSLKKGTHVEVEGQLRYRKVTDREQKDVTYTLAEIHLSKLRTVDPAPKDDAESVPPQPGNSSEDEAFVS